MAFSKEIEALGKIIAELDNIKELISRSEERVMVLEKSICAIDEALPPDGSIDMMKSGSEKRDVLRAIELTGRAYELVDEIIGPPDQMDGSSPGESAIMPEARGNDAISLEAALRKFNPGKFNPGGKNTVS